MRQAEGTSETALALWREAKALARRAAGRHPRARRLPPLLFFTDPDRTPDPVRVAEHLPPGAGVVFRHFGRPYAEETAEILAGVARRRRLVLLIGDDAGLAAAVGVAGVHLPERSLAHAPRLRARHPGWLITGAAHGRQALARAARLDLDAAVLSPGLPSRSPSAGSPLGPTRLAAWTHDAELPVYALGGVNALTMPRLRRSGIHGLAAVEALAGNG